VKALATLPKLVVELAGAPLPGAEAGSLGEVRVQQRLSLPTLCEMTFLDPGDALLDRADTLPGAALRVAVEGHPEPLFVGEVTAAEVEYGPSRGTTLRLRGYDRLHRLRKRQRLVRHTRATLVELLSERVADAGLTVEAGATGPVWDTLIQHRQSDLELLSALAERCGLYFTLRGETVHVLSLEGIGTPVELTLGRSLLQVRVEVNGDPACRSVETLGWDPWLAEPRRGAARSARVGRRVAAEVAPDRVGGDGERRLTNEPVQSDDQAEAIAQAELDRRLAAEVWVCGTAEGDPALRPGTPIELRGVARPLQGRYVLTAVTHTVDRREGFLSRVETSPPPTHPRASDPAVTVGRVTGVDDPEGLGRVRVSLPAFGETETDWLEVLTPGAGPAKGVVSLPDVGDRVLVVLVGADPAQAVVLGGLYGSERPPETGVVGGRIRRYTFVTPGGQRVQLDDEAERVRVENSRDGALELTPGRARVQDGRGSHLELTGDGVLLHAATDLAIEAPGRSITIRARRIDLEQA
jgi:phage protein D/phage baseplate assembly protein gpV